MKKFIEKHFDDFSSTIEEAYKIKEFLNDLGDKNHFIIKEVNSGFILEFWIESKEK